VVPSHLPVAKLTALCSLLRVQVFTNGAAMKRTDRISPVVWAIGIIVIATTIFFAWLGRHSHRANSQPDELLPTASASTGAPSATRSITDGPAQDSSLTFSRNIRITVTDLNGLPLGNSPVQVRYVLQEDGTGALRSGKSFLTDFNGVATVAYPQQNLNTLEISASHEKFSGRKMNWSLESGDVVPAGYTLKLGADVTIGAVVVDADSHPIPGATISLRRIRSPKNDPSNKKGEQSDFPPQTQTTSPDGSWHASALPADLMGSINFEITHSNFIATNMTVGDNEANERQLLDQTLKIVLASRTVASGVVIDENGRPFIGATVWAGSKHSGSSQETKTDSQGRFDFNYVAKGNVQFTASAPGYAAVMKVVAINSSTPDIVIKLSVGRAVHGVVQDESGSPILDVHVSLDDDNAFVRSSNELYDFVTLTDVEGKFSWNSAPAEPLHYTFVKEGYEQKRNVSLAPDEDNIVTLRAPRRLEGQVLDSNTGQPIPQFSILIGRRANSDASDLYSPVRNREFNNPEGRFTMQLEDADQNALQAWNDDHYLNTKSFPEAENGVIQLTIRLDPADALKGIVTTADGTPVPGAEVVATSTSGESGPTIQLLKTHFQPYNQRTHVALTDQQGAFSVNTPPPHGTVMAIANAGFALATVDEVRANHLIVIQAFGRIEGTLKLAGVPAARQSLIYTPPTSRLTADFNTYKTTTDAQGHFTMEKIPPGEGSIARLISTAHNSWTYSHYTPVTVQPGQTTQVMLGDSGAVLRGTVRFQSPPTNDAPLVISGRISGATPQPPNLSSSTDQQTYLNSPERQALIRRLRGYFFLVNADGSFQVDSVEPGSYWINASARPDGNRPFADLPLAEATLLFTVPDNADPMNPIFVGEIVLKPTPSR
jgi:uncharacterized GH25 family protein